MGQKWPDCHRNIKEFVVAATDVFKGEIPEKLDAVILHGSLAMGSFYEPKSDVDLLVIIRSALTVSEKKRIYARLINVTDNRPVTGFLELSVVLSSDASQPQHPVPYELHYSEGFPEKITGGTLDYERIGGRDPDLAAHFTVARRRGLSLFGPSPCELIGEVPWQSYVDAVLDDFFWIVEGDHILESPFYGVLNGCRVLQMLSQGEGMVANKEEGALWALENLPGKHHPIIRFALDCYRSNCPVPPERRRTAGMEWDTEALKAFRDFAADYVCRLKDGQPHSECAPRL